MHLADLDRGYLGGNGIVGAGRRHRDGRRAGLPAQGRGRGGRLRRRRRPQRRSHLGGGQPRRDLGPAADHRVREQHVRRRDALRSACSGGGSAVRRAEGFGLAPCSVDGQDVAAVYRAVHAAAERARAGGGASFVEARTYRYEGHNTGQIITYRTDEEVADWRLRDPINRFSAALVAAGDDRRGRRRAASTAAPRALIDDAVAFAESSPFPDLRHGAGQRHLHADRVLGVPMSETMTYAAAFQRAMGDEMERDETIFVLGTDLYVRGGHFAQVKGLGERFGRGARARHPDLRGRDGGRRRRLGDARHAPGRRSQLRRLRHGRDGRDRQPGGQDALHVRRQGAARDPRLLRRRAVRGAAHEQRRVVVRGHAGPRRRDARDARRRRRPARTGAARRRSRDLPHAQAAVVGARRGRRADRADPVRQGPVAREGIRRRR